MTENQKPEASNISVLLVDDNARYRAAFSRNLVLQGMQVIQAEHKDMALDLLKVQSPDVLITDLQMRTATEGLDLIHDARVISPCLPIIMISAVGTFDEGAQASKLGAAHVLSKARIEEEMEILYQCIEDSYAEYKKTRDALAEISRLNPSSEEGALPPEEAVQTLRGYLDDPELSGYVKGEAFEAITALTEKQERERSQKEAEQAQQILNETQQENAEKVQDKLTQAIEGFKHLNEDTKEAIQTAEYLYQCGDVFSKDLDLSRTICFSYCFSVENQAKTSLKKKLSKFLSDNANFDLIHQMQEKKSDHINMFLQQHLLQVMRDHEMDITIDNVRQTFQRILTHRVKYRPDGLKALGVIILLFGREYSIKTFDGTLTVENPLGMKGLEEEEVIRFAQQLITLQHSRNPYVHPEIDGQQTISAIRDTAFECMNLISRLK